MHIRLRVWMTLALAGLAGCGGGDGADAGVAGVPPARRGDVWEVRDVENRAAVPGSIVAFVNGVHVMVVDGDRIYAGMTELSTKDGADGTRTLAFPSGLTADLVPSGEGAELRFSTGERVPVGERADAGG